jgi:hypothetical protein
MTYKPGEYLTVDGSGAYSEDSLDGLNKEPTIDGTTTSFVVTDYSSNGIVTFGVKEKTPRTLILLLNEYEAKSGITIKKIRTDGEYLTDETTEWACVKGIDISASAPRTQQQNGQSEGSVKIIKDGYRTAKIQACTTDHLITDGYSSASQQHNRVPSRRDPAGLNRSPLQQFPTLPFQHKQLPLMPWGCRCFPHMGKITGHKSSKVRAIAGIYLCQDMYTAGHRVLNLNTGTVTVHAYVSFEPHRFPFRELQLAGEPPNQDFDPDAWRKYASELPAAVDDRALGEFCAGKQLRLILPQHVHPYCKGNWEVIANKLLPTSKKAHALRCCYSGYMGDKTGLTKTDKLVLAKEKDLWIDIPMSSLTPSTGAKIWDKSTNIRDVLKFTFPTATTLADYAAMSTLGQGRYPTPPYSSQVPVPEPPSTPATATVTDSDDQALRDGHITDDTVSTTAEVTVPVQRKPQKVILPARHVAKIRSTHATWTPHKSNMIPDRQLRTRSQTRITLQQANSAQETTDATDGRVGFEPTSLAKAQRHKSWPLWALAIDKEDQGLEERGTFTRVTKHDVPSHVRIMGSQYVFKDKRVTGPKARVVVRGDQQYPKPDAADTFSSTPSPTEIRTLISLAVQNNWALHSLDISQAFLQADELPADSEIYVRPPQGSKEPPGTIWKLRRPLYGLSVAPRAWTDTLKRFLTEYGFKPVNNSDTVFAWTNSESSQHMQLVYHVDDILLSFSHDECGSAFKRALLTRFKGTDEGSVRRYLGTVIKRTDTQIHISQEEYSREILDRFDMSDCNACSAPLDAGFTISKSDSPKTVDPARCHKFQEITGALQYLVQWTRPDLAFATNELAKVNSNPSESHLQTAYRVLRYLKGTAHLGLTYTRDLPHANRLIAFADADFAACADTRRSISSFITMMNGGAVSWKSRQQKSVATSTSQAEFVSASWAADEVLWLRRTLLDLHAPQTQPTPLWEDNRACRMMSENPVHRERSKHIDYRVHALRERVVDGVVRLLDCPTADMTADMGTKSLPAPAHCKHRDTALGLIRPTTPALPLDLTKRGGGVLTHTG